MPPQRRLKVVLAFLILLVVVFFFTRNVRSSKSLTDAAEDAFYSRTVDALNHKLRSGDSPPAPDNAEFDDDANGADFDRDGGVQGRLREAAQRARSRANAKSPRPDPPSKVVGQGNAAEGQMPGERSVAGRRKYGGSDPHESPHAETEEEHEVEVTLNAILKKSPSKSTGLSVTQRRTKLITLTSHHLFQIVLPAFPACQGYPTPQVHHRARSPRRRARRAPDWRTPTSSSCRAHESTNRPQRAHQRRQYWRRRRDCRLV